jgi:hypothetical protein
MFDMRLVQLEVQSVSGPVDATWHCFLHASSEKSILAEPAQI